MKIEVRYQGPLIKNLDDEIRKAMKAIGAKWYAQGTDLTFGLRDIAFEIDENLFNEDYMVLPIYVSPVVTKLKGNKISLGLEDIRDKIVFDCEIRKIPKCDEPEVYPWFREWRDSYIENLKAYGVI